MVGVITICSACPYWHAAGTPCPPGWHDVRSQGGGDGGGGDGGGGFPWGGLLWFTPLLTLALIVVGLALAARP